MNVHRIIRNLKEIILKDNLKKNVIRNLITSQNENKMLKSWTTSKSNCDCGTRVV